MQIAHRGRYQSGKLIDKHNMIHVSHLPWNGSASDNRGFIRPLSSIVCEDGQRHRNVLQMHPKWVHNGTIKAWLPWQRLPNNAVFKAKVGFLNGARGTNGAEFQVWEHHNEGGREVWNRIINYKKEYTGKMVTIEAELSHLSGRYVGIELRVDAAGGSGKDWAVWVDPTVESRGAGDRARTWEIAPISLTVHDRDEWEWHKGGGDEPYLGGIYFRSIFGKPGTTVVKKFTKLSDLGENVKRGRTVGIPHSLGFSTKDVGVPWSNAATGLTHGIQIMGLQLVAMEKDESGKSVVRSKINSLGDKLYDALKEHVEDNPGGIFNPQRTLDNIEKDVLGGSSGLSGGGLDIGKIFEDIGKALVGDDMIGQNQLLLVGLNESLLSNFLKDQYQPTARVNPVAALAPRYFTLDFRGSDAHYSVRVRLRRR